MKIVNYFVDILLKKYRCFLYYPFRHVLGVNKRIIGNISNLPTSIMKDNSIVETGEYSEKFSIGPIKLNPGPILLIHDIVAEKLVKKSGTSKHNNNVQIATIITYTKKYE